MSRENASSTQRIAACLVGLFFMIACTAPERGPTVGRPPGRRVSRVQPDPTRGIPHQMDRDEVRAFLNNTKLRRLDLIDVSMTHAIWTINETLRKQLSDAPRPKIILSKRDGHYTGCINIRELQLHDVPVGIALKYLCEATKCEYWIHNGTVVVGGYRPIEMNTYMRFLNQTRIRKLEILDANVMEAVDALRAAAEEVDFDGRKPSICMPRTNELQAAIAKGDLGHRVSGVNMRNVTIGDALREICKQAGADYHFFEGEIDI